MRSGVRDVRGKQLTHDSQAVCRECGNDVARLCISNRPEAAIEGFRAVPAPIGCGSSGVAEGSQHSGRHFIETNIEMNGAGVTKTHGVFRPPVSDEKREGGQFLSALYITALCCITG